MSKEEKTYTKLMSWSEYHFTQLASKHKIAPKILKVKIKEEVQFEVTMEAYDYSLIDFYNEGFKVDQNILLVINGLIENLHKLNILHGDLHAGNIVINTSNYDIKIIDFGRSFYNLDINEIELTALSESFGETFKTIAEYQKFEKTNYLHDLDINPLKQYIEKVL